MCRAAIPSADGAARLRGRSSPWVRSSFPAVLAVALLRSFLPGAARASSDGPVIASIQDIECPGVRRELFSLADPTRVRIRGEGAGDAKGMVLLARGWILDLDSRETVWEMGSGHGFYHGKSENWRVDEETTLPAGRYALYYAATDGMVPLDKMLKILGIPLGQIEASIGPRVPWDKLGDSDRWGIRVEAEDSSFRPAPAPEADPGPDPDAMVRVFGLGDDEQRMLRLELARPVEFRVRFTGEYDRRVRGFADGAWIRDLRDWKEVWVPDEEITRPAGGDLKNQLFAGTIRLPEGPYLLSVATDGSHSPGDWNAPPPDDPEAWGLSLDPLSPADRAAVKVGEDPGLPEPVLSITKMGDLDFERRPFSVRRPTRVFVRGLGEGNNKGGFADGGWIERLSDLDPIWRMEEKGSLPAGGDAKNRLVISLVDLPPGGYALCYSTDDSHSFRSWNADPPRHPEDWGISLAPAVAADRSAIEPGEPKDAPLTIALTEVGDDADLTRRFRLGEKVTFHLVALGEGTSDPLADRGWIEDAKTGQTVWQMRYRDSDPAGGVNKNRIVRADITLPKGEYELHYETDDSHAFGAWNSAPPLQPQLWGVTLIEAR